MYDVEGAAFGLSRLHSLYGIDTERMVKDGIIESRLQQHQVGAAKTSKPSVRKLEGNNIWTQNTCHNNITILQLL